MGNYAVWAIGLGGLILLFEAYKEYTTSDAVDNLKSNNQASRKELENVRMSALTTKAENRRGLAIYMVFFVGIYFVMLMSPELIATFVMGSKEATAATGGSNVVARSIVNPEAGAGPAVDPRTLPFWLAIAITFGAASPTFQVIERKIRAIAYFFAGVPRNIFRVLQSLEDLNYGSYGDGETLPLWKAFREKIAASKVDPIMDGMVQSIESSLRCIDLLQPPIIGPQSSAFRQLFNEDTPLARIDDLRSRYASILGRIANFKLEKDTLQSLQDETAKLADSMQCLFALYSIRSRKVPEALMNTPTAQIIEKVTGEDTAQSLHDITLASIFGAVFSYVLVEQVAMFSSNVSDATELREICAAMLIPLIPSLILLAFLTILLRHLRMDQGSWPRSDDIQIPFWDYAKLAFWPAFLATVLYGAITCIGADGVVRHALDGDGSAMITTGLNFLKDEIEQLPRIFLLSYVTACALLFVADQHDRMRWFVTVGIALVVSAFLLMVANLAASLFNIVPPATGLGLLDIAIMVTLPYSIFLVFYAIAAELAETGSMKKILSVVGTRIREPQRSDGRS